MFNFWKRLTTPNKPIWSAIPPENVVWTDKPTEGRCCYSVRCVQCKKVRYTNSNNPQSPQGWIAFFENHDEGDSYYGTCENCINPYTSNGLAPTTYTLSHLNTIVDGLFLPIKCTQCKKLQYTNLINPNELINKFDRQRGPSKERFKYVQNLYYEDILPGWSKIQNRLEGDFIGECHSCKICPECGGDGIETCTNPDHGWHDSHGCPACGHDPEHKIKGSTCPTCEGIGWVSKEKAKQYEASKE